MPLPLRDQSPGLHHVGMRGNNKRTIYLDDTDRTFFCATVDRIARKHRWAVLAYALMQNHYHLVLSIGDEGLATGMCELNTSYACTFNARHGRINHLFGRRYWNRPLTTDVDLMNAARYVVRNPVAAGWSKPLEEYRWTSYAATTGRAFADIELARDDLLAAFGRTPFAGIEAFEEYCADDGPDDQVRWQPP